MVVYNTRRRRKLLEISPRALNDVVQVEHTGYLSLTFSLRGRFKNRGMPRNDALFPYSAHVMVDQMEEI